MRRRLTIAVCAVCLGAVPPALVAQTPAAAGTQAGGAPQTTKTAPAAKKRAKPASKARKAAPAPSKPSNVKPLASLIAEQLEVVERFLYAYGRVSNGLELAAADQARGHVSPAAVAKNKENQAAVASNISGLWAGIDKVRAAAEQQGAGRGTQLLLQAALGRVQDAERLAQAGKFDDAGKSLVKAAEQLTEILRELKVENPGT